MRYFCVLYNYASRDGSQKGSGNQPFTVERGYLNRLKVDEVIAASIASFINKASDSNFWKPGDFSININQILEMPEADFNDWME